MLSLNCKEAHKLKDSIVTNENQFSFEQIEKRESLETSSAGLKQPEEGAAPLKSDQVMKDSAPLNEMLVPVDSQENSSKRSKHQRRSAMSKKRMMNKDLDVVGTKQKGRKPGSPDTLRNKNHFSDHLIDITNEGHNKSFEADPVEQNPENEETTFIQIQLQPKKEGFNPNASFNLQNCNLDEKMNSKFNETLKRVSAHGGSIEAGSGSHVYKDSEQFNDSTIISIPIIINATTMDKGKPILQRQINLNEGRNVTKIKFAGSQPMEQYEDSLMLQTDCLEDKNNKRVKVQVQNKQTGLTFKLKAQQKPEQPYVFELDYIDEMQFLKNNL